MKRHAFVLGLVAGALLLLVAAAVPQDPVAMTPRALLLVAHLRRW